MQAGNMPEVLTKMPLLNCVSYASKVWLLSVLLLPR
jgi:hypothetical protein